MMSYRFKFFSIISTDIKSLPICWFANCHFRDFSVKWLQTTDRMLKFNTLQCSQCKRQQRHILLVFLKIQIFALFTPSGTFIIVVLIQLELYSDDNIIFLFTLYCKWSYYSFYRQINSFFSVTIVPRDILLARRLRGDLM